MRILPMFRRTKGDSKINLGLLTSFFMTSPQLLYDTQS